jgi:hypothetical protein
MRYLVLSIDYEIFGNGSGDVRQHIIQPTDHMAAIAGRYGVPLTIYVELEECLAFERNASLLRSSLGYNPSDLIRNQVRVLARRGHDIQLHLHPEWYGARLENGRWRLDHTRQTVDSLFDTQEETTRYIADRKAALEEIVNGASGRRPVVAYRAGAFSAQPGRKLLCALAQNDFQLDSSVVKGLTRHDSHVHLDYRDAPSARDPWRVRDDVARIDDSGALWEIPIYSVMGRRFHQATFGRFRAKFSSNVPKDR